MSSNVETHNGGIVIGQDKSYFDKQIESCQRWPKGKFKKVDAVTVAIHMIAISKTTHTYVKYTLYDDTMISDGVIHLSC